MLHDAEEPPPNSDDDEVDEKVISALLETTGEADNESQAITRKVRLRTSLHTLKQKIHS